MTRAEQDQYRAALLTLRERLGGDVSHLTDEAFRSRGEEDDSGVRAPAEVLDQSPGTYDHEFTLELLENQEHTLEEIDEALNRLDQGTFGRCEECGLAIPKPRLRALPYTRHCVSCAEKQ